MALFGRWRYNGKVAFIENVDLPEHLAATQTRGKVGFCVCDNRRKNKHATTGLFPIVTTRPHWPNQDVIFIDPGSHWIMRKSERPGFNAEYFALRDQLASYLPTPDYARKDDYMIYEQFLNGQGVRTYFEGKPIAEKQSFAEMIIRHYEAASVLCQPSGELDLYILSLLDTAKQNLPALSKDVLFDLLRMQSIPSHSDLHPNNVIVCRDGSTKVIDVPPSVIKRMPFWYDGVRFLVAWDSKGFFEGRYDTVLQGVFRAFDISIPVDKIRNELAVCCGLLLDPLLRVSDVEILNPDSTDLSRRLAGFEKRLKSISQREDF